MNARKGNVAAALGAAACVWALCGIGRAGQAGNSPVKVFILAGQSNMEGVGIQPGKLDDYAAFLVDVVEHFARGGLLFDYLSPFNEPQWNWDGPGREGTPALHEELYAFMRYLSNELSRRGLSTRFELARIRQGVLCLC